MARAVVVTSVKAATTRESRAFDSLHPSSDAPNGSPILPWQFPTKAIISPVGARLQLFWRNWQAVGAEDWVLNVLQKGYKLHFTTKIRLSPTPIVFQEPRDPFMISTKHNIIMEYLEKGAIERVPPPISPSFYSFIFLRQKKSGKWRTIIT
jgi:hypothetical protein